MWTCSSHIFPINHHKISIVSYHLPISHIFPIYCPHISHKSPYFPCISDKFSMNHHISHIFPIYFPYSVAQIATQRNEDRQVRRPPLGPAARRRKRTHAARCGAQDVVGWVGDRLSARTMKWSYNGIWNEWNINGISIVKIKVIYILVRIICSNSYIYNI